MYATSGGEGPDPWSAGGANVTSGKGVTPSGNIVTGGASSAAGSSAAAASQGVELPPSASGVDGARYVGPPGTVAHMRTVKFTSTCTLKKMGEAHLHPCSPYIYIYTIYTYML